MNFEEFELDLDEEVDIYSFKNSLDDNTTNELRFICNSFCKYLRKMYKKSNFLTIVNNFDITLEGLCLGVLGTSFKTQAPIIYKELPLIKNLMNEELKKIDIKIATLEKELNTLKKENITLENDKLVLEEKVKILEKAVNDAKKTKTKKESYSYSSGTSYDPYDSYGNCGGNIRYGRC